MDRFSYETGGRKILIYRSVYSPLNSNMFVVLSGKDAVVFDPNENDELLSLFQNEGIIRVHILLTHGHYDHISGVEWLKEKTGAKVFCQVKCADRLANSKRPLARLVALVLAEEDKKDGGHRYDDFKVSYKPFTIKADKTFEKEEILRIGELEIVATSTPGHSEGSTCYRLFDRIVFTGDTLLQDNAAITRFPGGNTENYDNIAIPYLRSLSKNMIVMPGHGNPFVLKDTNTI